MAKDTDSFSLFDNANEDEGKLTTNDTLMAKMLADASLFYSMSISHEFLDYWF
jgi:hypothetical protein